MEGVREVATAESIDQPGAQRTAAPPFDDVYLQHRRRVFAICFSSLGNAEDAEDATQETFVKAAPHLAHFEGNVGAYLSVVARNVCCDEVRRRSLQRRAANELGRRGGREEIESRAVDRSILSRLLPRLSRTERELLLHSFAGYSYDEIADFTGSPVGTVRVRLARARKRARGLAGGAAAAILLGWRMLQHGAQRAVRAPGTAMSAVAEQAGLASGAVVTSLIAAAVAGSGLANQAQPVAVRSIAPVAASAATGPAPVPAAQGTSLGGGASVGSSAGRSSGPAQTVPLPARPAPPPPQAQSWVEGVASAPNAPDNSAQPGPALMWGHIGGGEVLFRSDDGGRSWRQLGGHGFVAGQVLVPPSFPANPTLFEVSAARGLLVSRDGGASWAASGVTVATGASPAAAAVMAASPAGHARVAADTGQGSIVVFDATSGQTVTDTPASSVSSGHLTAVVALGFAADTLLASVRTTPPPGTFNSDSPTVPAIQACPAGGGTCTSSPNHPSWSGADLQLLPVIGSDGRVAVLDGPGTVYTTSDGANFSSAMATGLTGSITASSARLIGGRLTLALQGFDASTGAPAQAVLLTPSTRTALASLPDTEASAWLLLPGATLLGGGLDLDGGSQPGVRCSHDAGGTWTNAC